jgi:hypothetical protein
MILSLTPFLYINMIYPDELYVLMLVVVSAAMCRWCLTDRPPLLYLATLSCLVIGWLRPVGMVLAPARFGLAVWRQGARLASRDLLNGLERKFVVRANQ